MQVRVRVRARVRIRVKRFHVEGLNIELKGGGLNRVGVRLNPSRPHRSGV